MLVPRKGCFGLVDYEKAYTQDLKNGPDIFDLRGIDRKRRAMIVVRPDQLSGYPAERLTVEGDALPSA